MQGLFMAGYLPSIEGSEMHSQNQRVSSSSSSLFNKCLKYKYKYFYTGKVRFIQEQTPPQTYLTFDPDQNLP